MTMKWFSKSAPAPKLVLTISCLTCSEPMHLDFVWRPGVHLVDGNCPACQFVNAIVHSSAEQFYLDYLEAEADVTYYQWRRRESD